MTAAFLFAVALQYNDPDPIRWMAIYGMAALTCILAQVGVARWTLPALVGTVALVWAATLFPHVAGKTDPSKMFEHWHMISETVEEEREMFGLLIVAAWMLVLGFASRRKSH
jgi:hypothetical protein